MRETERCLVQNGNHPFFEETVIYVWFQQIANSVDALFVEFFSRQVEASNKSGCQAFDEVLLHSSSCGDDTIDHVVPH